MSHHLNSIWYDSFFCLSCGLGITQPVHPANAVETKLNNVTAPFTTCSNIDRMKEPPKNGEGSFLDSNKCLELIDNSLQVGTELGFKSASDNKVAIVQTVDSNSNFGKEPEVDFFFVSFFRFNSTL